MPKGDAKEGYLNTNAHLEAKVAMLMAQLAESQAREVRMREAIAEMHDCSLDDDHRAGRLIATTALALPADDSALREMIEAAKAEEREACADLVEQRSQRSRTVRAAINGRQPEPCEYAAAIRAMKG